MSDSDREAHRALLQDVSNRITKAVAAEAGDAGLTPADLAGVLLIAAATLANGVGGPAVTAQMLRALADDVERRQPAVN